MSWVSRAQSCWLAELTLQVYIIVIKYNEVNPLSCAALYEPC